MPIKSLKALCFRNATNFSIIQDDSNMNGCHFGKYGSMVVFNTLEKTEKYKVTHSFFLE